MKNKRILVRRRSSPSFSAKEREHSFATIINKHVQSRTPLTQREQKNLLLHVKNYSNSKQESKAVVQRILNQILHDSLVSQATYDEAIKTLFHN